jgi:putative membrane protein
MSPDRRRLHRAAIAVNALKTLRGGAVPLLVVLVLSVFRGGVDLEALIRGAIYAGVATTIAVIVGYLTWATTTWWVTEDAIHFRTGLLGTKQTDVPLARVQALDLEQGPMQRLFGVYSVHVQTGGGGSRGEITLDAVGDAEIAELRALVGGVAPAAAHERTVDAERRLSAGMLLVAALTAGQLGVILPALAGAGQLLNDSVGEEAFRLLPDTVMEWVLAGLGLLVVAWLLSVAGAVVAFAGFTLERDGDRLRIRRGLLARREATVPVERVRAVEVVEGVLRRPFGLAALRMEVIGHAEEPTAAQLLFPLLRRGDVRELLDRFLPELADDLDGLEPLPRRALRRYVVPPAAAGVAVGAAAWIAGLGPAPLLVVVPAALYGWARWRDAGWRLSGDRLAVRSLRFARRTLLAPARRRESHTLAQTLLQRRVSLADLEVAFGKSATARVHHLEASTAQGLFDQLSHI